MNSHYYARLEAGSLKVPAYTTQTTSMPWGAGSSILCTLLTTPITPIGMVTSTMRCPSKLYSQRLFRDGRAMYACL